MWTDALMQEKAMARYPGKSLHNSESKLSAWSCSVIRDRMVVANYVMTLPVVAVRIIAYVNAFNKTTNYAGTIQHQSPKVVSCKPT